MQERQIGHTPDDVLTQLQGQLEAYMRLRDSGSLRDLTIMISGIEKTVSQLGHSVAVAAGLSPTSARSRIRSYFKAFPHEVIDGCELAAISGIAQYARRIRELREEGFVIRTGPKAVNPKTQFELRPDQYLYTPMDQATGPVRR